MNALPLYDQPLHLLGALCFLPILLALAVVALPVAASMGVCRVWRELATTGKVPEPPRGICS